MDALSRRDLERLGKSGPDKAPALGRHTVTVGTRGPSPRTVSVPEGVDPGFAYAPGRVAALGETVRHRLRRSLPQPPGIAARGVAEALSRPANLSALVEQWQDWRQTSGPASEIFELGALSPSVLAALAARGVSAETAAVTISRQRIQHIKDKHSEAAALTNEDIDRLPAIITRPAAVLYDLAPKSRQGDVLLYVFDPAGSDRRGKVVIELDFGSKTGPQRTRITTNAVRTAGYVEPENLRNPRYAVLDGGVEDE